MAIKLEGGGKALVAWPLVDELFFCGFIFHFLQVLEQQVQEAPGGQTHPHPLHERAQPGGVGRAGAEHGRGCGPPRRSGQPRAGTSPTKGLGPGRTT